MPRARRVAASLSRIASGPRAWDGCVAGRAVGRGGVGARRSFGAALVDNENGSAEWIRIAGGSLLSASRAPAWPSADGGRAEGCSGGGCVIAASGTLLRSRCSVGAARGGASSSDVLDRNRSGTLRRSEEIDHVERARAGGHRHELSRRPRRLRRGRGRWPSFQIVLSDAGCWGALLLLLITSHLRPCHFL